MQKNIIKNSFKYSLERSVPILIGFFPVGTVYGLMMSAAGYNFLWSAAASLFVYAGSLQMLMISFFQSDMSILTIAVTALLLNSRHMFYGLSFIEKFRSYGGWKWFLIYGMPDESYSLLCSYVPREGVEEKWVHIFSTGLIWLYWIAFSVLGGHRLCAHCAFHSHSARPDKVHRHESARAHRRRVVDAVHNYSRPGQFPASVACGDGACAAALEK